VAEINLTERNLRPTPLSDETAEYEDHHTITDVSDAEWAERLHELFPNVSHIKSYFSDIQSSRRGDSVFLLIAARHNNAAWMDNPQIEDAPTQAQQTLGVLSEHGPYIRTQKESVEI